MRGNQLPERDDGLSFDRVYETYADKVLNIAYRMTGDEDAARDLTQDIFLKVYQNLDTFERRSNIYTWIYRIAVNHIYNYLKKERRTRWFGVLDMTVQDALREEDVDPSFPARGAPSADRVLEDRERAAVVWKAVRSLPPKYRVPLALYHYEGMSYKEIAESTDLSMSAVESRIHRARKKLIKLLEPWIDRI
jgi:RNA polymerase sigma-70 factor (ECF subfamily)